MANYANAISMLNSNYFANRDGATPRYIILHGTAGGSSAQNIATYFASTVGTSNPVSSHYVIGTDGVVVQCVNEADGAFGNGVLTSGHAAFWNENINPNNITISIEHCKPNTDNSNALTAPQQAASFALVKDICSRWNIPMRNADANGGITGHFSIDPVSRANCPGPYPWPALWKYLSSSTATSTVTVAQEEDIMIELDTPGVSQFWAASADGAWRCTASGHNYRILGDIRSFYVRFANKGLCGVTYLGLPLTEMFVPKTGTYGQLFERGYVVNDPKRVIDRPVGLPSTEACYLGHIDAGTAQTLLSQPIAGPLGTQIKSLEAQLTSAQATGGNPAQVADLQAQIKTLQSEISVQTAKIASAVAALK
jgi:N-acetyl-anhydromuramyl-L-alanine amidase AmpD